MKRVTYSNAFSFTSINVDDVTLTASEAMTHSLQHYIVGRVLRMIDTGNARVNAAIKCITEGRRSDAARYMIEPEVTTAEWAEWMMPTLLGLEGNLDFINTLKIVADRAQREVRNEIRNYPWKAVGLIDFARVCEELIGDIERSIHKDYALAHKQNKARDCGFDLEKGCIGGRNLYEAYRKLVANTSAVLPPYEAAEFYIALGDSTGIPASVSSPTSTGIPISIHRDKWLKATEKVAAERTRNEEKAKARKR